MLGRRAQENAPFPMIQIPLLVRFVFGLIWGYITPRFPFSHFLEVLDERILHTSHAATHAGMGWDKGIS